MKKYKYSVVINSIPETEPYFFNYGNTKNIELRISENKVSVTAEMTVKKEFDEVMCSENKLFSDAVKKALLIHIIKYSSGICIENITVYINDEKKVYDEMNDNNYIYSLVNGKLLRKIPKEWNNPVFIQAMLNQVKSRYDSMTASVFAYIYSQTKEYEIERFIYLWMSLNGMYNFFSNFVKQNTSDSNKINKIGEECNQIRAISYMTTDSKGRIFKKDSKFIAFDVISVLKKWDGKSVTYESMTNGIHKDLADEISEKITYRNKNVKETFGKRIDITSYAYVMFFLAYYYRCNVFHANKPVPLFSYIDEPDLRCLSVINGMLEKYISENLYKWFDEDYVENFLKPEAKKAYENINWNN